MLLWQRRRTAAPRTNARRLIDRHIWLRPVQSGLDQRQSRAQDGAVTSESPEPENHYHHSPVVRAVYLVIGWTFVAIGIAGIFLPVLPTTPFLLISLWAFSKSSPRLYNWLYTHPQAGPYIVAWDRYHVIPLRAKILAVSLMTASWLYLTFKVADGWMLPTIVGLIMLGAMAYVLPKPNHPPADAPEFDD